METQVLMPSTESIDLACKYLKNGEIVALPTETVYGLAGDYSNSKAINKIFTAKGRPQDNPLIVHISDIEMLNKVVGFIPKDALKLAKTFWPGPLTMILPKGNNVCSETCAGLNSVGVRIPDNETTRQIIRKANLPLSAPSANISGKPSPTNANDVYMDMNGKIPLIIDGGDCKAGVESTVLSLIGEKPIILRPGVITKLDIEKVLNKEVLVAKEVTNGVTNNSKVLSPGMKYTHYSPNAEVVLIKSNLESFINFVKENSDKYTYAMCFDEDQDKMPIPYITYGKKDNPASQAQKLFSTLRKLDKLGAKKVYVRCPEQDGVSLAVYNRLIRSAGFNIIEL